MQKKTLSYLLFAHISLKCIWIWPDTHNKQRGKGMVSAKSELF